LANERSFSAAYPQRTLDDSKSNVALRANEGGPAQAEKKWMIEEGQSLIAVGGRAICPEAKPGGEGDGEHLSHEKLSFKMWQLLIKRFECSFSNIFLIFYITVL
jgi:hypothetical protein